MSRVLRPLHGGLSYYDSTMGRFVTEGPDVTDAKAKLRELDGDLDAWFDQDSGVWNVTWFNHRKNQNELVLFDTDLERAYQRVLQGRNDAPGAETGDQMSDRLEREQAELQEQDMEGFREVARDAAERLIFAFKKDGIHDHENIYGPKPRRNLSRRDVRVR